MGDDVLKEIQEKGLIQWEIEQADKSRHPRPLERGDWKTLEMPARRKVIGVDYTFSEEEMGKIRRGFLPRVMEDKWFIYCEGDILNFHRSWTGICIFRARISREGNVYKIREFEANRDSSQYENTDDGEDASLMLYLVEVILLERPCSPFPRGHRSPELEAVRQWGVVGRAMLDEDRPPDGND